MIPPSEYPTQWHWLGGACHTPRPVCALGITWKYKCEAQSPQPDVAWLLTKCRLKGGLGATYRMNAGNPLSWVRPVRVPATGAVGLASDTKDEVDSCWHCHTGPVCVYVCRRSDARSKNRQEQTWPQCVSWELQGPFWGTWRCQMLRYCRDDFNSFVAHWNSGRLPGKQYNSLVPQQMSKSVTRLKNEKHLTAHLQNCAQTPSE